MKKLLLLLTCLISFNAMAYVMSYEAEGEFIIKNSHTKPGGIVEQLEWERNMRSPNRILY